MPGEPPVAGGVQQEAVGVMQGEGGNGVPTATSASFACRKPTPAYSLARTENSRPPATMARARPVAATGTRTRTSFARGTSGQKPSRRRFSGTMAPTSRAMPKMWAVLVAA